MREIIFRGKRTDNGEWVEGWLVIKKDPILDVTYCFILAYGKGESYVTWYPVDPSTVGQYTGLKDKNGRRIFEGDIVAACFRNNYSLQKFKVNFADGMFLFDNSCVRVPRRDIYGVQIIGNVHDNPELIGGNDGT